MKKLIVILMIFVLGLVSPLSACSSNDTQVVLTTGLGKNDIFMIGNEICHKNEFMLYLTTMQNRYQNVYGKEIWNVQLKGVTLEQNVKDIALAQLAQIKTMYLLALSKDLELDENEKAVIEKCTSQFYSSLNETEIKELEIDEAVVKKLYTEYALSDKVYRTIIKDVNPEISDDEARIVKVQHIFLSTIFNDSNGNNVAYSNNDKEAAYKLAISIREQAVSGEVNFEELATKYSDDDNLFLSFGKGELDENIEEAAFKLENGEISEVIESSDGYHIMKCISTFDEEETNENKLLIVEKKRSEAFSEEYDAFVETLVRKLNENLWKEIGFINNDAVVTSNFFEIYKNNFL